MTHQTSKWVTISEEDAIAPSLHAPNSKKTKWLERAKNWLNGEMEIKKPIQKESVLNLQETLSDEADVVKHKWFWATGFVAVMVFTAVLLVPDKLSAQIKNLIPGNLFESQINNAIENYDGVSILPPFPGSEADLEQQSVNSPTTNNTANQVVQADAQAVDVQVDPVPVQVQPNNTTTSSQNNVTEENTPQNQAEGELLPAAPVVTPTQAETKPQDTQDAALAAQQALIAQLTEQLDAFKKQSDAQAQQLNNTQNIPLFPAAGTTNQALQTTQILGQNPSLNAAQLPQEDLANTNTFNEGAVSYRLNPYKVSLTPQQILAQNQGKLVMAQNTATPVKLVTSQAMQANVAAANAKIEQVTSVPQSGPMNLIWLALAPALFVGFRTFAKKA